MSRRLDAQLTLALAAGLVITGLTGVAFWLSYAHLAEVAAGHGLGDSPERAWAWPATLDAFIVAGELLMLRAALTGRGVDWWAVVLTVAGSGGSIALNVAGVGAGAEPLDYVVAAVPPTAALLAFGALMRQIHQHLAGRAEADFVNNVNEVTSAEASKVDVIHLAPGTVPERDPVRELAEVRVARETGADFLDVIQEVPTAEPELERVGEPVPEPPEPARVPLVPPGAEPGVLGPFVPPPALPRVPARQAAGTKDGTGGDQRRSQPEPTVTDVTPDVPVPSGSAPEPPAVPSVPPRGSGAADIESADTENTRFRRHVERARNWLAAEPELTGSAIGERLGGFSDSYGRRVKRAALAARV